MKDTIIKGTGNSRTLASVPNFLTLYPTYEAFAKALIAGELPIDLGPLNPAGVQQAGTDLNKTNLLKDATAALYGLTAAAVPDEVLAKARQLITAAQNEAAGRGRIEYGSYTGTGKSGAASPNRIVAGFPPKAMLLSGLVHPSTSTKTQAISIFLRDLDTSFAFCAGQSSNNLFVLSQLTVLWDNLSVSWYNAKETLNEYHQLNTKGQVYYYLFFG